MKVWVTRSSPGAEATAARLTELGHEPLIAPLLTVRPIPGARLDFKGVGALAFTSAQGVTAFAARYPQGARSLPVYAVGDTTAESARRAGFADATSADGDVAALTALILARRDDFRGSVLHPSAKFPAGDLAGELTAAGVEAVSTPIYDTAEAAALPPLAVEALQSDDLDAVLVHSPRAAAVLARLIVRYAPDLSAYALSEACAAPLRPIDFREIAVADAPNDAALLGQLTKTRDGRTQGL